MKRRTTLLLLMLLPAAVFAFDVGAYFTLSNLDFARDRTSSSAGLPGDTYLWGLDVTGHEDLSDQLALDLSFTRDTILRNLALTRLSYTDDFFSIAFGPFFGLLNSPGNFVQSGISTTVELFIPGITFVRLRSDNSLSGRLVVAGDYLQEQSELAFGFYTPNVIPTIYVQSKRYTLKTSAGENIDSLNEYGLRTDIFQKNVPYQVVLNFAYQSETRQFVETTTTTHTFGSVVMGVRLSVTLFEAFTILADLDASMYTFGLNDLVGEVTADRFLFRLCTGLEIDLDQLTRR